MKRQSKATAVEQQRFEKRRQVVAAVQSGETVSVVARVFKVPIRSVFLWLARYRRGGWDGLREGKRQGRPSKLSSDAIQWLYDAITLGGPRQHQFEFCLWTLQIIRGVLMREYKVELSKSAVCRLLAQLGLSPQRPIYKSYKQNPKEMEKYLKKTFPKLQEEAKRTGAVIFFVDEAAVRSDAHRGTTWSKIGQTPVVRDSGDRFGLRLISAVSPRGDMRFAAFEGKMNGGRFVEFIDKLRSDVKRRIIVIADNASYHGSGPVREYCAQSKGQVIVHHLPPYCPEFNPDEQVWNHAKARLGKLVIISKTEMTEAVHGILFAIQSSVQLIRSFFQLTDTKYAAAY